LAYASEMFSFKIVIDVLFQVIEALLNVDRLIGQLMDGLKQRHLDKCVNLVLLSDHGKYCDSLLCLSCINCIL